MTCRAEILCYAVLSCCAVVCYVLCHQVDVISRGHSGYNSRWGVKVFEEVLKQLQGQQVALLVIWLGANDAAIPDRSA